MKRTLLCATAAAAIVSVTGAANADEGWYVRADFGFSPTGNLDHDPAVDVVGTLQGDASVEENFGGWVGAGYDFGQNVRLETTFGYRAGDLDPDNGFNGLPLATASPLENGDVQVWDAMVNLIYDLNNESRITPYAGAGVGLAQVNAGVSNLAADPAA
ncbi:MAG: outer membrane beta-barrel protein, partial [Pseudomonadota bacterium]